MSFLEEPAHQILGERSRDFEAGQGKYNPRNRGEQQHDHTGEVQ
jgi:hypothetical protein